MYNCITPESCRQKKLGGYSMVDVPESHVKPSGNLLTVCELENGPVEIVDVSHEKW